MQIHQKSFRRIVTGHDTEGKAIIISDAPIENKQLVDNANGPFFFEVWQTLETPALIHPQPDDQDDTKLVFTPPINGTRMRVIEFPPQEEEISKSTKAKSKEISTVIASTTSDKIRHLSTYKTSSVDYGIVLEGEISLILDQQETTMAAGDILIQNGTSHAWINRSGKICRIALVLIDGEFTNIN